MHIQSDRRQEERPGDHDRRRFPRPPLWLTLSLLLLALAMALGARLHRTHLDKEFAHVLRRNEASPIELNRIKSQLAGMDLTKSALARELDARLRHLNTLDTSEFHISIDTQERKFFFHYGDTILREAPVQIGPAVNLTSADKKRRWTFVPLKGAFRVTDKAAGLDWRVSEWLYAAKQQPVPPERPVIENGLGEFILFLPNDYIIHSPPPEESPLDGPKPGSFMVPADVLRAIWPRVREGTDVFIF